MKKRSPIHAYKRLLANDHDWDYGYLIAVSSVSPPSRMRLSESRVMFTSTLQSVSRLDRRSRTPRQRATETRPSSQP